MQDRKIRGFDDIAILYRTHRQADLLETCLKKEGIPYVVTGRESFLEEECVKGSIQFFKYLLDEGNARAKEQSLKYLWKLEENVISEKVAEKTAQKFRPLCQGKNLQEFMETWIGEMHLEGKKAMQKLMDDGTYTKILQHWGVESGALDKAEINPAVE